MASTRPLQLTSAHQKGWERDAAKKIVTFLTANGWSGSVSATALYKKGSAPSTTLVADILTFLMQLIDPLYRWEGDSRKFAEMVIGLFKLLGYPVRIDKSTCAMSPHAWPKLLAAVDWFVDLLTYDMEANEIFIKEAAAVDWVEAVDWAEVGPSETERNAASILQFAAFLRTSYLPWLQKGYDEADPEDTYLDNEMRDAFAGIAGSVEAEVAALEAEAIVLEEELAALNGPAPKAHLEETIAALNSDEAKYSKYIQELNKYMAQMEGKIVELGTEKELCSAKLAAQGKTLGSLRQQLDAQPVSAANVKRLKADRTRLAGELSKLQAAREAAETAVSEASEALRATQAELQDSIAALNAEAQRVLAPETADFSPVAYGTGAGMRRALDPALRVAESVLAATHEAVPAARNERNRIVTSLAEQQETVNELTEEVERQRGQLERLRQAQAAAKETMQESLRQCEAESEAIDDELRALKLADSAPTATGANAGGNAAVVRAQAALQEARAQAAQEQEEANTALATVLGALTQHKAWVQSELRALEGEAKQGLGEIVLADD